MNENVILYIIQVHTDLPQVIKLISLLDDGQNKFLINVDPTFYDDIQGCEVYFPCQTRERITVRRGLPITWGGASQMCAWVDAYRHAMLIDGWEFAVMLSGSCVPLVPQHVIRNHLHADNERGVRVHCFRWDWEISSSNFYSVPIENPASMLADCVETSIGGRIPALICRDLLDFIQNDNSSPILHAHRRGEIVCIDNLVEKN
ncbi:beta-1,6-N-acetylglucosaminyltransferase [Acetobacter pasteurianus]|uniref:beta-1,6-N-acetylglucosaminyltransferase n=1 Tax=Acetobacter pasteurianus TaxID=438 RepID=UPI003D09DBB2